MNIPIPGSRARFPRFQCFCTLAYFNVSTVHRTLSRATGSLTCVCDRFAYYRLYLSESTENWVISFQLSFFSFNCVCCLKEGFLENVHILSYCAIKYGSLFLFFKPFVCLDVLLRMRALKSVSDLSLSQVRHELQCHCRNNKQHMKCSVCICGKIQ